MTEILFTVSSFQFQVYSYHPMKLIVGLGNPGKEYAATRHNVGFWLVDLLAETFDGSWKTEKARFAECAKVKILGQDALLAKPQTFMNESG